MDLNRKKISVTVAALLLLPAFAFAAQTQDGKAADYNMVLISLVILMLVLLFVIGMLANVLRLLTAVVREKINKEKTVIPPIIKAILLLIAFNVPVIHAFAKAAEDTKQWASLPDTISGIPTSDYFTIVTVLVLELSVIFALIVNIRTLMGVIRNKPELAHAAKAVIKKSWFWDKFNAAATIEHEKDILLDHDYDGIQELDNSLPPWWKYGFYLTIIVSVIYLYRFHISHDGLSQEQEYTVEMQKGEEEKAAYLAKSANNVDENTVTQLTDAASISDGHEMFIKTCAACHVADGGGNVGPNLTDEYWLHGGGIKDIFKSIKYGWQDKGMKSWKDDYSPKQIQELASFIKSLKGSHPAVPKAPQGDLYIEASQGKKPTDSAKANTGSTDKNKEVAKVNK